MQTCGRASCLYKESENCLRSPRQFFSPTESIHGPACRPRSPYGGKGFKMRQTGCAMGRAGSGVDAGRGAITYSHGRRAQSSSNTRLSRVAWVLAGDGADFGDTATTAVQNIVSARLCAICMKPMTSASSGVVQPRMPFPQKPEKNENKLDKSLDQKLKNFPSNETGRA
jgi:hypothetical protein